MNSRVEAEDARWLLHGGPFGLGYDERFEGGWDNSNYHLRLLDGSEVVLKAWFANTLDEVDRVIQRHLHLDSHGIQLPCQSKCLMDTMLQLRTVLLGLCYHS